MNWTAVVYGGPMLFIIIWWFISARKWFKGPKVNVAHMMIGDDVVEGEALKGSDAGSSSTPPLTKGMEDTKGL